MATSKFLEIDSDNNTNEDDSLNLYLGDLGLGSPLRPRTFVPNAAAGDEKDRFSYLHTIYEKIKLGTYRREHCNCCKCQENNDVKSLIQSSGFNVADETLKVLEKIERVDTKPTVTEDLSDDDDEHTSKRMEVMLRETLKEVNDLQFQLECTQGLLEDSQSRWSQRFDCCNKEKDIIWKGLKDCIEELRKLTAVKSALERQRDELMAYLDVKEKLMYEDTATKITEEYNTFTSSDLMILAVCHCRDNLQRPCNCAIAACNKQREIQILKEKMKELKNNHCDTSALANAYRWAFEEQLNNNKQLLQQMAALSLKSNKNKVKRRNSTTHLDRDKLSKNDCYVDDVADILADLLMDKIEALAHQRILCKTLARKVQDLEETLKAISEYKNEFIL